MPSNQTEKHETNRDTTCVDTIDLTIRITCRVLCSETNTTGKLQKNNRTAGHCVLMPGNTNRAQLQKKGVRPFEMSRPISSKP